MRSFIDSIAFVVMCFVLLIAGCIVGAVTGSFIAYAALCGSSLFLLAVQGIRESM